MKATLSMAALVMLAAAMPAIAQKDLVDPCIHCEIKGKVIEDLKSQIRQLKAETSEPSHSSTAELLTSTGGGIPVTTEAPAPAFSPINKAPAAETTEVAASTTEPEAPAELQAVAEPEAEVSEAADTGAVQFYTVQPGDGMMKIGRKTGHSAEDIAKANGLTLNSVIHPGQKLKLPGHAIKNTPAAPDAAKPKTYKIKEGDTYYSLARRLQIPLDELMAANPQAKATELYEGRIITLPVTGSSTPPPAPAATTDTEEPAPAPTTAETNAETLEEGATAPESEPEKKIRAIKVIDEISYGDFASQHQTTIDRLNSLNDLNLTSTTILAKGSELYVPAQP